jgi:hypothetical protein
MSDDLKVIIPGVTRLEQLDLEDALAESVDFRPEEMGADQHGEFLTAVAVVTLSALAIKALAVWLAKNRSRDNLVEEEVTLELPEGTRMTRRIRAVSASASQLPEAVVSALQDLVRTPTAG